MAMELRHLSAFVAVAEELHFGRAAERLHIAQPPLSRQIQRLEKDLGVLLLRRTKRRVELTEAGECFLDGARRTLSEAEQAARMARRAARGEVGRLVLGFVGTTVVLPPVLREFRARFPEVELVLHQLTTARQVQGLRDGWLHLGLLRPPVPDGWLIVEPIAREAIVVAVPDKHPLAARARIPLTALAEEAFIMWPRREGPGFHDLIVSACHAAGFTPRVVQEATEMVTILNLVAGGLGIALMPESVRELQRRGVTYLPLKGAAPRAERALAWRADETAKPVLAFIEVARELRAKLGWAKRR